MISRTLSFCLLLSIISTPSLGLAEMSRHSYVTLQALEKPTARTSTFSAPIGKTVKYGPLYIRPQSCSEPPATERPESAAFLQVWEILPNSEESEWVFSGWMFASSPGLSSMDHPVFDVWVLDCHDGEEKSVLESASSDESAESGAHASTEDAAEEVERRAEEVISDDAANVSAPIVSLGEEEDRARFQRYERPAAPTVRLD